ncbi:MAG: response regulator [Ginsengibacter sp.]
MPEILLADDHAIVRKGLRLLIQDYIPHSNIDEACDGSSALEKIKQKNYDLVLMDINMPDTDSFITLETILAIRAELKVLIFSMNSEEVFARRFLRIGAKGYLSKDSSNSEIQKAIEVVLEGKTYISPELSQKLVATIGPKKQPDNPFDKLSSREFEIVQHMAQGNSVSEMAKKLNLHTSTVGTYKGRIFEKLQVQNLVELLHLAKAYDVIFPD